MDDDARQPDEEFEKHPATIALCLIWVGVYLAMCWDQGAVHAEAGRALSGGIAFDTAHRFGTLTPLEVLGGQWWRALTATFIHLSLFHLGFNLLMFYQLGRLVEPWYGPWQFLGTYVVIGTLGNVLAAVGRVDLPFVRPTPFQASAGGSGVICGLIALVAVVGWRSRTNEGRYYCAQMVGLLVFIALIGVAIPQIGNFEHAGGAIAGALVGFAHRRMVRLENSAKARIAGLAGLLAILGCGAVQARVGLAEWQAVNRNQMIREVATLQNRIQERDRTGQLLVQIGRVYRLMAAQAQTPLGFVEAPEPRLRRVVREQIGRLETRSAELRGGTEAETLRRYCAVVWWATVRWPTRREVQGFLADERALLTRLRDHQKRDEERLRHLVARIEARATTPGMDRKQAGPPS